MICRAIFDSFVVLKFRLVLVTLLLLASVPKVQAQEQSIHALRSAYLYYFSHFISWPEKTEFTNNELKLCVLTDDEKDRYQLSTIENKNLGVNTLHIQFFEAVGNAAADDLSQCHMMYVAERYDRWLENNTDRIDDKTLLVTEGGLQAKGDIHLFKLKKKLKFEINHEELMSRQFKVSSKLLRLSRREGA
ncbi:YfiR family protein [Teredinibacter haidensis]|uniref:YfiR family protein n=1 Tax=Teredinibacter haidensis TaxID=2731755 RepID=UPI000948FAA4|nr:YfiR family protein [Teredinibacter haidensis]